MLRGIILLRAPSGARARCGEKGGHDRKRFHPAQLQALQRGSRCGCVGGLPQASGWRREDVHDAGRSDEHGICTTGANLEEDIFNLVAHNHYERVPNYRNLSDAEEVALRERGMNRVTDTCIPEEEAMRRIERQVLKLWQKADKEKQRYFPYEFMYQLIRGCHIKEFFEIDPKDSWVVAACEKNLPIFTPGRSEERRVG